MGRLPGAGELYKDAANRIYQVAAVAVHANTSEQMVVYQAMFGDFGIYTMPLQQFLGEADAGQGPQAVQQPLFKRMEKPEIQKGAWKELHEETRTDAFVEREKVQADAFGQREKEQEGAFGQQEKRQNDRGLSGTGNSLQGTQSRQSGEFVLALKARTGNNGSLHANAQNVSGQPLYSANTAEQQIAGGTDAQPANRLQSRPRTQSPAEARRVLRRHEEGTAKEGDYEYEKRRRQLEEREQRREMFRRTGRQESASEELRANPCLMKFLEAKTYDERFQVLKEIQDDMTDRLIDDIAVVLDVVIPEGELHDRFRQLQNIILTRQKYEISRFR
ncbi:MAG: DUF1653 domain-containing protein [Eubacterium sp.]|nr:DUF1653 domain-containing protein [Eubacterium sp.]